jgi:hypothetical protein
MTLFSRHLWQSWSQRVESWNQCCGMRSRGVWREKLFGFGSAFDNYVELCILMRLWLQQEKIMRRRLRNTVWKQVSSAADAKDKNIFEN